MSRSISYRKGTSSGFSTAINVRCRNEKINVISVNTLGWIDIHNSIRFLYVSTYIYISKDMEFFLFQVRKSYPIYGKSLGNGENGDILIKDINGLQTNIGLLKVPEIGYFRPKRQNFSNSWIPKYADITMLNLMPTPTLTGTISSKERIAPKKNRRHGFKLNFHFSFRAAHKGCEMRERTAVKVARFVHGRGGMSNPSFLFNCRTASKGQGIRDPLRSHSNN